MHDYSHFIPSPNGALTITSHLLGADTNANVAAAVGWAVDSFTCWETEPTEDLIKSLFIDNGLSSALAGEERFVFSGDSSVTEYGLPTTPAEGDAYYLKDAKGRDFYMMVSDDLAEMEPGAPRLLGWPPRRRRGGRAARISPA